MDNREKINTPYTLAYDSKRRFVSYWHQIQEVMRRNPASVLEVGIGNGFISRYLRNHGVSVITVDKERNLLPDIVADITALPFRENSFEVATACEVLEHIPYTEALRALKELRRVASLHVILSLPDATHAVSFQFPIPFIKKVKMLITIPYLFPRHHTVTKSGHQWEIGKKGYPLSHITHDFEETGLKLIKTYRVFENPYHRFFIFRK